MPSCPDGFPENAGRMFGLYRPRGAYLKQLTSTSLPSDSQKAHKLTHQPQTATVIESGVDANRLT